MSNTWISNIIRTAAGEIKDDLGNVKFKLLPATGKLLDPIKYALTGTKLPAVAPTLDTTATAAGVSEGVLPDGLGNIISVTNPAKISTDGGKSYIGYEVPATPTTLDCAAGTASNPTGDLHYMGTDAGIYSSTDGLLWEFVEAWPNSTVDVLYTVRSNDNALMAFTDGVYNDAHVKVNGGSWATVVLGDGADVADNAIIGMDGVDDIIVASTGSGKLKFSNDNFTTYIDASDTAGLFGKKIAIYKVSTGYLVVDFASKSIYPMTDEGVLSSPIALSSAINNAVQLGGYLYFATTDQLITKYDHNKHVLLTSEVGGGAIDVDILCNDDLVFSEATNVVATWNKKELSLPNMSPVTAIAPFKIIADLPYYAGQAHFDPAEIGTLWKDAERTDPVTAVGDAVVGITDLSPNGNHAIILGEFFNVEGLGITIDATCFDGADYWILCRSTATVYKFLADGSYAGVSVDISTEDATPTSITFGGGSFWMVGTTTKVYQYDSSWVYSGTSFTVTLQTDYMTGITYDGTYIAVASNNDGFFTKYTLTGTNSGNTNIDGGSINNGAICWDGSSFWVFDNDTGMLNEMGTDGVYTGNSFDLSDYLLDANGIAWDGTHLLISSKDDGKVYKFTRAGVNVPAVGATYQEDANGLGYFEIEANSAITVPAFSDADKVIDFLIPGIGHTHFTAPSLTFQAPTIGLGRVVFYEAVSDIVRYLELYATGTVTSLEGVFQDKATFNEKIGDWKLGSITTLANMFNGASAFNQDISKWDISSVTDMSGFLANTSTFNRFLGMLDTTAVTNMDGLLINATAFDQNLLTWSIDNVLTFIDFVDYRSVLTDAYNPFYIPLYSAIGQIGDVIITGDTVLYNSDETPTADLLVCDGSTFDETVYPDLFEALGTNVLPNIPDEDGSPFPYKIVADYTGE